MTILLRVLAPENIRVALRFLISAIQSKVLQHFLSMNLITHPQRLFSLTVSFDKEAKEI